MAWSDILEILKYIIPSLVTFLTAYLIIRTFIEENKDQREMEIRAEHYKEALPIRLQAYERMTLFLERISPTSLITRVSKPGMNARELQIALISNIRMEYDHNLAQQIYVSTNLWMMVVQTKEEIVSIINRVSVDIPENAPAKELSRRIFEFFINNEQAIPTQKALDTLKGEVKKIF